MERSVRELQVINARFIDNYVTNDVVSHDRLLHKDFVAIQSDGAVLDRATYLAMWAHGFDPDVITYWDLRDEHITVLCDVALVRATNKCTSRGHTGMTMYTDTYVRVGGAWKCAQAQTTRIAPGNEPGDDTVIAVYHRGIKEAGAGR